MTEGPGAPPSPVVIRKYQAKDKDEVYKIFAVGLLKLDRTLAGHQLTQNWKNQVLAAAIPAVTAYLCRGRPAGIAAAATISSAAVIPVALYIFIRKALYDYVNHAMEDDLSDIEKSYSSDGFGPGSAFWVAERVSPTTGKAEVVGLVGLERKSPDVAELRRMSVKPGCRNLGIASKLCKELLRHAAEQGFKSLFLTTSSAQTPAMALYKKLGWDEDPEHGLHGSVRVHKFTYDLKKSQ